MSRALLLVCLVSLGCATTKTAEVKPAATEAPLACPTKEPTGAFDPAFVLGQPIVKVCLLGAGDETYLRLHEVVVPREGHALDAISVRDDLSELYRTELIRDARAFAEPTKKGVMLVYAVTERAMVSQVVIEGAPSLSHELRYELQVRSIRDTPSQRARLLEAASTFYEEAGFPRASVEFDTRASKTGTELVMRVTEGPRFVVHAVRFDGAKKLTTKILENAVQTRINSPARQAFIDRDVLLLSSAYFDNGLVLATVSSKLEELPSPPGAVDVVFTIVEGDVFTTGAVTTKGLSLGADVQKSLELKKGSVFSRAVIQRDLERLKARAQKQGLVVEVTPLTTIDSAKKRIDLTYEIAAKPE